MRQEIRFTGMSTRPSAHDAPGGELDYCAGLVNDGDGLVAGEELTDVVDMMPTGGTGDYIFKAVHEGRKIVEHKTGSGQNVASTLKYHNGAAYGADINTFAAGVTIGQVSSLGKYLVVLTSAGVMYALWEDGSGYAWLGAKPPRLDVRFGLETVKDRNNKSLIVGDKTIPSTSDGTIVQYDASGLDYRINFNSANQDGHNLAVQSAVAKLMSEKVAEDNYFAECFWVRYGYHMRDGSTAFLSAPVLMVSDNGPKYIATFNLGNPNTVYDYVIFPVVTASRLMYRLESAATSLTGSAWARLIRGIDIYITKPVPRYDANGDVPLEFHLKRSSTSVDWEYHDMLRASASGLTDKVFTTAGKVMVKDMFYNDMPEPPRNDRSAVVDLPQNADYAEGIKRQGPFYRIATVSLDGLPVVGAQTQVPISSYGVKNLTQGTVLEETFRDWDIQIAEAQLSYNARLNLGRIKYNPFNGYSAKEQTPLNNLSGSTKSLTARVYIKENGADGVVEQTATQVGYGGGGLYLFSFFYPNRGAYKARLYLNEGNSGVYLEIPLEESQELSGAFWVAPALLPSSLAVGRTPAGTAIGSISYPNRVIQSNVASLSFPAKGVQDVGQNSVRALATTAKSVHEFQSGQDPLYVFTDDAVWAMSLNDDGTYLSVRPASYDPIKENTLPVQTDDSVAFISRDGIRVLSGGESVNISDILDSQATFRKAEAAKDATPSYVTGFDPVDIAERFREFLTGAFLHFDYENKRLYVMHPSKTYGYVFSKEGKAWSLVLCPYENNAYVYFAYSVQRYPDSYVVMGTKVWKFTPFDSDTEDVASGLVFTRPMALADGALFNVAEVKAEGVFTHTAKPQLALYGTLDYKNWQLVATCQGPHMRGVRCPPFKAIRVGVNAPLTRRDSLTGVTIEFNPRFTARVR